MTNNLAVGACTVLLLLTVWIQSWTPLQAQASAAKHEKLQFVAVLSRHGVRTPQNTPKDLQAYAPEPWRAAQTS